MNTSTPTSPHTEPDVVGLPSSSLHRAFANEAASKASDRIAPVSTIRQLLSFPAMLGSFLVGAVFVAARTFSVDPDLWWHIRTGDLILRTHQWPTTDSYSYTVAGQPWLACEWIGDVLTATVFRLGGLQGLDLLLIALGSAVMLALYGHATARARNSKAGLAAAAILFLLANASFSLRPQMLGYLFLVLTLLALERFRQGRPRALYFLPVLFLVWVNTHGSFVIGIGAIVAHLLCGMVEFRLGNIEARRWSVPERLRLEIVLLASIAALTVTPYGTQLAVYPFHVASSLPVGVANVSEWQSMPFNILGGKIFLALVMAFFVAQMALRLTVRLEELLLVLGGIGMACLHIRFLLVFVPFFAPVLVVMLAHWIPPYDRAKDRYALNAALIAALVVGMVHYFPSRNDLERIVADQFPVQAVAFIRANEIPRPIFNSYNFGGYLVYENEPVFVDGRADPYERGGSLADYFHITRLKPGALKVLESYRVGSCLLGRDEPLATVLAALPQWKQVYGDTLSVLFVREDLAHTTQRAIAFPNVSVKE
jgi:hypothetical protein